MHARTRAGVVIALVVFALGFTACDVTTSQPVSSGGFTTQARYPKSVVAGSQATFVAIVTSPGQTVLVDLEVYDPAGVKAFQQAWDNQAFNMNQQRKFRTTWSVPATARIGTYTLKIGVFSPGWGQLYQWNDNAGTFTVTAGTGSTTSSSTTTTTTLTTTSTTLPSGGGLPSLPAGMAADVGTGHLRWAGGCGRIGRRGSVRVPVPVLGRRSQHRQRMGDLERERRLRDVLHR